MVLNVDVVHLTGTIPSSCAKLVMIYVVEWCSGLFSLNREDILNLFRSCKHAKHLNKHRVLGQFHIL